MHSIRKGVFTWLPAPRSTMTNVGRSASRGVRSRSQFRGKRRAQGQHCEHCRWEKPLSCAYAGFARFGFGYRRCPGKQWTIWVFEEFLRKISRDEIVSRKLNLTNPGQVPVGPNVVIREDLGFGRLT